MPLFCTNSDYKPTCEGQQSVAYLPLPYLWTQVHLEKETVEGCVCLFQLSERKRNRPSIFIKQLTIKQLLCWVISYDLIFAKPWRICFTVFVSQKEETEGLREDVICFRLKRQSSLPRIWTQDNISEISWRTAIFSDERILFCLCYCGNFRKMK